MEYPAFSLSVPLSFTQVNIPYETNINSTHYPIKNKKNHPINKFKFKCLSGGKKNVEGQKLAVTMLYSSFSSFTALSNRIMKVAPLLVFSPHLIKLISLAIIENWLAFCAREAT